MQLIVCEFYLNVKIQRKCYLYTMGYYSDIKKNESLPFAATWMDSEGIMLNEISQRKTNTV